MQPTSTNAIDGGAQATVCLTFDNLGEAAEIELGLWPKGAAIGAHYTVLDVLPRLQRTLTGLPSTFFVEGWNAEVYPAQIAALRESGHEIALHGWRHENWSKLDAETELALIDLSLNAFGKIGIKPEGFRPPGGKLLSSTGEALRDRGFVYTSPEEPPIRNVSALTIHPFHWPLVDAFWLEPLLGPMRHSAGLPERPASVAIWRQTLQERLAAAIRQGGVLTILFHPYLLGSDPEQFECFEEFISTLRAAPVDVMTCSQYVSVAHAVHGNPFTNS